MDGRCKTRSISFVAVILPLVYHQLLGSGKYGWYQYFHVTQYFPSGKRENIQMYIPCHENHLKVFENTGSVDYHLRGENIMQDIRRTLKCKIPIID